MNRSNRNSAVELLRIISMIMIVLYHIVGRYKMTSLELD